MNNKLLQVIYFIFCCIFVGCATSYAPENWLPKTEEVPYDAYGSWIYLELTKKNDENVSSFIGGEFITFEKSVVYCLNNELQKIPLHKIRRAVLEIDSKNTSSYGAWTVLGMLSSLSHGFYLIISMPIWLITGSASASAESYRDRFEVEYPDSIWWFDKIIYSRFPQGLPSNIDSIDLKPRSIVQDRN